MVWWSLESQVLSLNVQAPFGLRRDDLIVKDVQPEILQQRLDAHKAWEAGRTADISAASHASIDVITATRAAATSALDGVREVPVMILSSASDSSKRSYAG